VAATYDRRAVQDVLQAEVAPAIGRTMAAAAIGLHFQKLGVLGQRLTPDQLEAVLARLSLGLVVFVGDRQTREITARIRSRLAPRAGGA
jgi:hypothetical protein